MRDDIKNAQTTVEVEKILDAEITWDDKSHNETFGETAARFSEMGRDDEAAILRDAEIRWWQIEEPGKYDDNGNIRSDYE